MKTPQEIEVWYIIPIIRAELSKELKKKYSQKKIAELLDITDSAISQYIKSKRAYSYCFAPKIIEKIRESAQSISKKEDAMREIQLICQFIKKEKVLCEVHRRHESIGECSICMEK